MKKETVTTNQITEGVIWKQLLLFFFPIVLGTFFQQLYNTADTIVVGRFVSKEALAAVGGSAAQIVGLIVGFFVGLASGASVIISQFYGAKNRVQLNRALHTAYAFSIVGSIFITALGILIAPWMLELMHTPQETMADALLYLRIIPKQRGRDTCVGFVSRTIREQTSLSAGRRKKFCSPNDIKAFFINQLVFEGPLRVLLQKGKA